MGPIFVQIDSLKHIMTSLQGNPYCTDRYSCVYCILISVKEMNHYTTDPSVGGKHQGKEGCEVKKREAESHCYNRLKIDQISTNDFFRAASLPLSTLTLHSHESLHISR